ncbi:MAG: UDP-N-acetylmuramoyl-L-alanine--D-glutamate ligase, partial [Lachnospiraceae bacterium]|nr:UDP-N-acetylmuramoyl-L-alanine--D-glutamate ligase [Lachnospiraceae bacterium]
MKDKVLVLGGGKTGVYASKVLLMKNFYVILYDDNKEYDATLLRKEIPADIDFKISLGDISDRELKECKFCVISPGFPKFKEIVTKVNDYSIPMIGELELGYLAAKGNMCAVTGTNGKTTVVKLVGEILKKHYIDVH